MTELLPFIIILMLTSIGIFIAYILYRLKPVLMFLPTIFYGFIAIILLFLYAFFDFGMGDIALILFGILFGVSAILNFLFILSFHYHVKKKPH